MSHYTYNGKEYSNLQELYVENIQDTTTTLQEFESNVKSGMSVEEAMVAGETQSCNQRHSNVGSNNGKDYDEEDLIVAGVVGVVAGGLLF